MRRSRGPGISLAALFLVATVNQFGCGVIHCIAAEPDVPSCHSSGESDSPSPSSPEKHEGACCVAFLAERHATPIDGERLAVIDVALAAEPALGAQAGPARCSRVAFETGPPGWSTGAVPRPLRI